MRLEHVVSRKNLIIVDNVKISRVQKLIDLSSLKKAEKNMIIVIIFPPIFR